jgi:hypothetical protein
MQIQEHIERYQTILQMQVRQVRVDIARVDRPKKKQRLEATSLSLPHVTIRSSRI